MGLPVGRAVCLAAVMGDPYDAAPFAP